MHGKRTDIILIRSILICEGTLYNDYKSKYIKETKDKRDERLIHKKLGEFRIRPDREFFVCPLETIISAINEIVDKRVRVDAC